MRWAFSGNADMNTTPAIGPDGTVVAAFGSHVSALDGTGHEKWHFFTRNTIRSSPVIAADGAIYFGSDDSTFYCLNPMGTLR